MGQPVAVKALASVQPIMRMHAAASNLHASSQANPQCRLKEKEGESMATCEAAALTSVAMALAAAKHLAGSCRRACHRAQACLLGWTGMDLCSPGGSSLRSAGQKGSAASAAAGRGQAMVNSVAWPAVLRRGWRRISAGRGHPYPGGAASLVAQLCHARVNV